MKFLGKLPLYKFGLPTGRRLAACHRKVASICGVGVGTVQRIKAKALG
jgi:hypothetical protein